MSALVECSIEPSSSTGNSFLEQSEERVKEWPSGETTLPANNHRPRLVGIDDERNEHLYPRRYQSVDVGKRTYYTTIYDGTDDEHAVGRGGEITDGSFWLSGLVNMTDLAELSPGAGPWFDVKIASGYSRWEPGRLIGDKLISEYSNETWQDWSVGIADPVRNRKRDTTSELMDAHLLSAGLIRRLKRSIPEGITTYEFYVTSSVSETTQEVKESVLERIVRLRRTPEEERAPWGTWPDERAFDDALTFARAWSSDTIRIPDVGLADDGEVNFLWEGADVHVDLGFYGDGTFSYYAKDGDGKEYTDDDVPAHVGLPADLLAILKSEA